jgi:large subunit ribosomal protein L7/L12
LDLSELVKVLEDHFGVSAAAPVAVAAAGGAAAGEEAAAETKSSYNIFLSAAGDKKIDVIKAVREVSGLGLAESKGVVDGAPAMIKEGVPAEEAEEAKKKLEEAGATIELQ